MNNLNPYYAPQFKQTFKRTEIYKKLILDFDENDLIWDKFFLLSPFVQRRKNLNNTKLRTSQPNASMETPRAKFSDKFSASIFYYLMPLIEHGYTTIYDLGCGKNMFKTYIPSLIGIGGENALAINCYNKIKDSSWPDIKSLAEWELLPTEITDECINYHHVDLSELFRGNFYGDIYGYVDDEYVANHQNYFESVFSICALHFHPIDQFCKVVEDFSSMVQINGCGFISINLQRMVDFSSAELLTLLFGTVRPTQDQLDEYIRSELDKINLEWLIVDVDLLLVDEPMDGNIRLVFKK